MTETKENGKGQWDSPKLFDYFIFALVTLTFWTRLFALSLFLSPFFMRFRKMIIASCSDKIKAFLFAFWSTKTMRITYEKENERPSGSSKPDNDDPVKKDEREYNIVFEMYCIEMRNFQNELSFYFWCMCPLFS